MKRILALLLTMTMFLSLCTVAFAGQVSLPDCSFSSFFDLYGKRYDNAIRYVSLGDSTSMGFYVGTYDNYYCYRHDTPCGVISGDYSTYTLFSKYLASQGKVRGTDLTSTGMRPMELHAILDEDFFISLNPRVDASDNNGMIYDSWCMDHLDNYMFKQNHYSYKDMFGSLTALSFVLSPITPLPYTVNPQSRAHLSCESFGRHRQLPALNASP